MKKCPVPGCCTFIPSIRFVCHSCWEAMPQSARDPVKQAKRHIQQYRDDPVRVGVWRMAHVRAQEAAIAAVIRLREAA